MEDVRDPLSSLGSYYAVAIGIIDGFEKFGELPLGVDLILVLE